MKNIKMIPGAVQALGQKITRRAAGLYERAFPRALEKRFVKEWTQVLTTDAKVYTGMYTSLARLVRGKTKKPEKVLREWVTRTTYRWEDGPLADLCGRTLTPAAESGSAQDCAKWALLLLQAAYQADVTRDRNGDILTLDDASIMAYTEWDGQEIYSGDTVKVVMPAWYQNGRVLEQGQCTLVEEDGSAEKEEE